MEALGSLLQKSPEYGANASAKEFTSETLRYIRITDIDDAGKLIENCKAGIDYFDGKQYLLNQNDILIARTGNTVGKSYIHSIQNGECAFAGYLIRFVVNQHIYLPKLLFHYLHSPFYWKWVKDTARTGAQPNINSKEYQKLLLPVPPVKEQEQITEILSTVDSKLEVLQDKKAQYQELKKGLMQHLLTGKLRVNHLIEQTELA